MQTALEWLESGAIKDGDKVVFELQTKHKQQILKRYFQETGVAKQLKMDLMEKVIGSDKSDLAENTRLTCLAGLPDKESKAENWKAITDVNSEESLYKRSARMAGFYSWGQLDLVRPYFDQFYNELRNLQANTSFKYCETFFYSMLPRKEITDSQIVKLVQLKNETPDSQDTFAKML